MHGGGFDCDGKARGDRITVLPPLLATIKPGGDPREKTISLDPKPFEDAVCAALEACCDGDDDEFKPLPYTVILDPGWTVTGSDGDDDGHLTINRQAAFVSGSVKVFRTGDPISADPEGNIPATLLLTIANDGTAKPIADQTVLFMSKALRGGAILGADSKITMTSLAAGEVLAKGASVTLSFFYPLAFPLPALPRR